MIETMFFAVFHSSTMRHDRREYFSNTKTLKDFHDWLEKQRNNIEKDLGSPTLIENIQYIIATNAPEQSADEMSEEKREAIANLEPQTSLK